MQRHNFSLMLYLFVFFFTVYVMTSSVITIDLFDVCIMRPQYCIEHTKSPIQRRNGSHGLLLLPFYRIFQETISFRVSCLWSWNHGLVLFKRPGRSLT
jgi:hypothetical protein